MDKEIILLILGMSIVTYLPRLLPFIVFNKTSFPQPILSWLSYIPTAILAAILIPSILVAENRLDISFSNSYLMASLPTFVVAILSKNMVITVVTGIISIILLG